MPVVKGRPFKNGRVTITDPAKRARKAEGNAPAPLLPPSNPDYLGHAGERMLHTGMLLVDLGYTLGEHITLRRIRPDFQPLSHIVVSETSTVGEITTRFTRTSFGACLGTDVPGSDRGILYVWVRAGVDFDIEIVNAERLLGA